MNGIHYNMPFEEYRDAEGYSFHVTINRLRKSVSHALAPYDGADNAGRRMGRAVHCAVLEPGRFATAYAVTECEDARTKPYKDDKAAAETEGKELLKRSEFNTVLGAQDALRLHPYIAKLLAAGRPEVSIFWNDLTTGLPCKGRIDWLTDTVQLDLKTHPADPETFMRLAFQREWDVQAAWYRRGALANGAVVEHCVTVAVEVESPYGVTWYRWTDEVMEYADKRINERMVRLAQYLSLPEDERWGGYPRECIDINLPGWMAREKENDNG